MERALCPGLGSLRLGHYECDRLRYAGKAEVAFGEWTDEGIPRRAS